MMILTVREIVMLHSKLIAKTGGLGGVRDMGLLESAVANCFQTFGGEALYPDVIAKAARMAYGICRNHPFADGNKRTAILAMLTILSLNHITVSYSQAALIALGLGIAEGKVCYTEIISWIKAHASL
jgi:death-on-curing protein